MTSPAHNFVPCVVIAASAKLACGKLRRHQRLVTKLSFVLYGLPWGI